MRAPLLLAVVLFVILLPARVQASAFTYQWTATLDHCVDEGIYCDWWGGLEVGGTFTYDSVLDTFTAFDTAMEPGGFSWLGPSLPDTDPADGRDTYTAATGLGGDFWLVVSAPVFEQQHVWLNFSAPIAGQPVLGVTGLWERQFAGPMLTYTFGDGIATLAGGVHGQLSPTSSTAPVPAPEPATLLLLGSGLAAIAARGRRRR